MAEVYGHRWAVVPLWIISNRSCEIFKNFFNTWIYIQIKILYENRSLDSLKDETAKKLSLTKIRILADESFFEIKLSHKSSRPQRKE